MKNQPETQKQELRKQYEELLTQVNSEILKLANKIACGYTEGPTEIVERLKDFNDLNKLNALHEKLSKALEGE